MRDQLNRLADRLENFAEIARAGAYDSSDHKEMLNVINQIRTLAVRAQGVPEGWRCFHCGAEFADRDAAAIHFGKHELQDPACMIDIEKFREMEALQLRYLDEDAEVHRAMHRMRSEHQQALRRSEEAGYAKGLADAAKYPQDAMLSAAPAPDPVPNAHEGCGALCRNGCNGGPCRVEMDSPPVAQAKGETVEKCGAPKDGFSRYPECGCETEAECEYGAVFEQHAPTGAQVVTDEMVKRAAVVFSGAPFPSDRSLKKARAALAAALKEPSRDAK